jgi:lyso-ornithine lipid O-acyltransferase
MRGLRPFIILVGFAALTLPLMPLQQIFKWTSLRAARWLPWAYHGAVCRLLSVTLKIEGVRPATSALLVSNHVSWLDIPILSAALPLSFIAKREVGTWPFFSALARLQRTVFIDRERRLNTGSSRNDIAERLQAGDCLVLFPEGTSSNGRSVQPFKSAFFGAVEGLEIPVIPVTVAYKTTRGLPITHRQRPSYAWYGDMDLVPHLWAAIKQGPLFVTVQFHDPLTKADRKAMARVAENTVRTGLVEALHGRGEIR